MTVQNLVHLIAGDKNFTDNNFPGPWRFSKPIALLPLYEMNKLGLSVKGFEVIVKFN